MSKYSEALERILHYTTDTKNSEIKLLLEAISKAEMYDKAVNKAILEIGKRTMAIAECDEALNQIKELKKENKDLKVRLNEAYNNGRADECYETIETREALNEEIFKLQKENQILKEAKERYKAMVEKAVKEDPLREPFDKLLEENRILKEGIEDLIEFLSICSIKNIFTDAEIEIENLKRSHPKIKAMLEMVEE